MGSHGASPHTPHLESGRQKVPGFARVGTNSKGKAPPLPFCTKILEQNNLLTPHTSHPNVRDAESTTPARAAGNHLAQKAYAHTSLRLPHRFSLRALLFTFLVMGYGALPHGYEKPFSQHSKKTTPLPGSQNKKRLGVARSFAWQFYFCAYSACACCSSRAARSASRFASLAFCRL